MNEKKYPSIWTLKTLCEYSASTAVEINGKWVPARPFGIHAFVNRIRCAWLVFTGNADAVIWPEGQ